MRVGKNETSRIRNGRKRVTCVALVKTRRVAKIQSRIIELQCRIMELNSNVGLWNYDVVL